VPGGAGPALELAGKARECRRRSFPHIGWSVRGACFFASPDRVGRVVLLRPRGADRLPRVLEWVGAVRLVRTALLSDGGRVTTTARPDGLPRSSIRHVPADQKTSVDTRPALLGWSVSGWAGHSAAALVAAPSGPTRPFPPFAGRCDSVSRRPSSWDRAPRPVDQGRSRMP